MNIETIETHNKNEATGQLEQTASYVIGKTAVYIDRVFRSGHSETLADILIRLMKKEAQNL